MCCTNIKVRKKFQNLRLLLWIFKILGGGEKGKKLTKLWGWREASNNHPYLALHLQKHSHRVRNKLAKLRPLATPHLCPSVHM